MNLRHFLAGSAVLLAFSGPSLAAGGGNPLLGALAECAAVADGSARLACYDRLAPQVKAALAAPTQAVAAAHPPTAEEQKSWFGFDMGDLFGSSPATQTTPEQFGSERTAAKRREVEALKQEAAPAEVDSITAGLSDYAMTPFGKFIVFLDNGQVWRELKSEPSHVYFKRDAKSNSVEIERGMLGSYILHVNGSMRGYKVERVK